MVYLADAIKKEVNVPVITVGSLDASSAEYALSQKKADLAALGRALIADPELPNKLMSGHPEDILPCCRGNEGCFSRFYLGQSMRCELNPACGRERAYSLKANTPKRVVVVGGGIAGMEAARVAALAGHMVALYEKTDLLGGNMIEGCAPAFKEKTRQYMKWLKRQLVKSNVSVVLNVEVTPSSIRVVDADAIILAIGSDYVVPPIEGIENAVSAKGALLSGVNGNKVIVVGGGLIGCETALMLAEQGKNVTVLDMLDGIAEELESNVKAGLISRMEKAGVTIHLNTKAINIQPGIVECENRKFFACDTVINATGLKARNELAEMMASSATRPVYIIGDCREARKIYDATHGAWQAVLDISS
jgi:2-enoate reductase